MLGRRGLAQAAFTNPELRELGEMTDADVVVDPADAALDPHSAAMLEHEDADPRVRRNVDIATEYSTRTPQGKRAADRPALPRLAGRDPRQRPRRGRSGSCATSSCRTTTARCRARADRRDARSSTCGLVFRSIGYRGSELAGLPVRRARGTIRNEGGRVVDDDGRVVPGVYAAGWIKRGPTGVIGTNKKDAARDRRRAARGLRGRAACPTPPIDDDARSASSPSARPSTSTTRAGSASTPTSRRSASRTAARA